MASLRDQSEAAAVSDLVATLSPPSTAPPSYGNGFWRPEEEDVVTINGDFLTADLAGASHASLVSERLYRVQQSQHSHVTDSGLASSHRTPYLRGSSEAGAQRSMEIVLSWNPPAAARGSIGSFLTNTVQRESSSFLGVGTPTLEPSTYAFCPLSSNSMLLVPPASAGPRPHYHVSVHLDCFNPTSYSTVVRRGESEAGQYVGEFKLAGSNEPDMVTIGAETMRVSTALTVIRKKGFLSRLLCHRGGVGSFEHSWIWRFGKVHLLWRCNDDIYECALKASEDGRFLLPIMVATFVKKSTAIVGRSTHQRLAELKVYPKGLAVLDQIVVSILVIARGI
ncbi:hypothetical protein HETIRDRAFT_118485 [Heterobasidion irregulare TC 32-1]|uniref:DUF6593 domain-containing protein n=1 Tax=Heterobasidion irregulare (strain TC 32-1) TaxID=747525 RepID=W4JUW7_HETIT|nr:uncharacterized protein HETIRDRAFT_118485 [Heterobasidion irregulare TC 32-1]ETW77322.1 hypothetical protein HETIRDRAFT_118485 [Heterobasidion irregulare TC 32-1]